MKMIAADERHVLRPQMHLQVLEEIVVFAFNERHQHANTARQSCVDESFPTAWDKRGALQTGHCFAEVEGAQRVRLLRCPAQQTAVPESPSAAWILLDVVSHGGWEPKDHNVAQFVRFGHRVVVENADTGAPAGAGVVSEDDQLVLLTLVADPMQRFLHVGYNDAKPNGLYTDDQVGKMLQGKEEAR